MDSTIMKKEINIINSWILQ